MKTVTFAIKIKSQEKRRYVGMVEFFSVDSGNRQYVFHIRNGVDKYGAPIYRETRYNIEEVSYFKGYAGKEAFEKVNAK